MLIGFLDTNLIKKEKIKNNNRIIIFIIPDCPLSARAIRMLRTLQIEHEIKVSKMILTSNLLIKLLTTIDFHKFS